MSRKPLLPLVITVSILFLSASGLTVYAARAMAEKRASSQTAGSQQVNDEEDHAQTDTQGHADETAKPTDLGSQASSQATTVVDAASSATISGGTSENENIDNQDEDKDDNDDEDVSLPVETASQLISLEKAKAIALDYVGSGAVVLELELERDDNPPKFEIKLEACGYEYEIEIHAITGAIIDMEREPVDSQDAIDDDGPDMD